MPRRTTKGTIFFGYEKDSCLRGSSCFGDKPLSAVLIPSIDLQAGAVVQLVQGERLAIKDEDVFGWH